jgi:hypothetical protein
LTRVTIFASVPLRFSHGQEELMSVAFSIMEKIRHRLQWAFSPSYRRIRQRLDEIAPR